MAKQERQKAESAAQATGAVNFQWLYTYSAQR